MNNFIGIGRTTRDPELTYTQSGVSITRFTLAINRIGKKDEADFINVVCFNKVAENVANYVTKGQLIAVQGRVQTGNYTNKEGQKVYTTDIAASQVEFLEFNKKDNGEIPEGFHPIDNDSIPF